LTSRKTSVALVNPPGEKKKQGLLVMLNDPSEFRRNGKINVQDILFFSNKDNLEYSSVISPPPLILSKYIGYIG